MSFLRATVATYVIIATCMPAAHVRAAENLGGFGEVLSIIEINADELRRIDAAQPSTTDLQIIQQLLARFDQHARDLDRWTIRDGQVSPARVGELFALAGTMERVDAVETPAASEFKRLYRCRLTLDDGSPAEVLVVRVPASWAVGEQLAEPVTLTGVLLRGEGVPLWVAPHVSWFPTAGLTSGKLLLARFGMDAALWDEIVQGTPFVSPERRREAEAFFACLAAVSKVPVGELARLTLDAIAQGSVAQAADGDKQQQQIAAAVAQQALRGLSSVAPLFLEPEEMVGTLVRFEGIARRAVRIVTTEQDRAAHKRGIHEYFELEIFTADSQNLPIVCCVTRLPERFPTGDAIRVPVRVDGVFFKLWRYHSRQLGADDGETTTPERSYTPVVMAPTVTWLQQASSPNRWWGLVVGVTVFAIMFLGVVRMVVSRNHRRRLPNETPDFSRLGED